MNLAGVEIILNMRRKIRRMQTEVNEFMGTIKRELSRGIGDWEQRLSTRTRKVCAGELVRATPVTVIVCTSIDHDVNDQDSSVRKRRPGDLASRCYTVRPRFTCCSCPAELCDDTGWKPLDEHGVRRVVRCDCKRQQAGGMRLA